MLNSLFWEAKVSVKAFSARFPFKILIRCLYSATPLMGENNQQIPNHFFKQRPLVLQADAMLGLPHNLKLVAHSNEQKTILVTGAFFKSWD